MQFIKFTIAASAVAFLAGCLNTDAERAVAGAAAGAFCDDAGLCN